MHDIDSYYQNNIDLMGPSTQYNFKTIKTNLTSNNIISDKYTELKVSSLSPDNNGKYKKFFPYVYTEDNIHLKIINEDTKNLYLICNNNQKFCDVYGISGARNDGEVVIRSGEEMLFSIRLDKYNKYMIIPTVV